METEVLISLSHFTAFCLRNASASLTHDVSCENSAILSFWLFSSFLIIFFLNMQHNNMKKSLTFRYHRYHSMDNIKLFQSTVSIQSHSVLQLRSLQILLLSFCSSVRMNVLCTTGYVQWWFLVLLQMPFMQGAHCQPSTLSFGGYGIGIKTFYSGHQGTAESSEHILDQL